MSLKKLEDDLYSARQTLCRTGLMVAAVFLIALIYGCASKPPITPDADSTACPDISGRYVAKGRSLEKKGGIIKGTSSLALQFDIWLNNSQDITSVDVQGVRNGELTVHMYAGEQLRKTKVWRENELRCGDSAILLRLETSPIGGAIGGPLPIIGAGMSAGWRLFRKAGDGRLITEWHRRDTILLFFIIPLTSTTDAYSEFDLAP